MACYCFGDHGLPTIVIASYLEYYQVIFWETLSPQCVAKTSFSLIINCQNLSPLYPTEGIARNG